MSNENKPVFDVKLFSPFCAYLHWSSKDFSLLKLPTRKIMNYHQYYWPWTVISLEKIVFYLRKKIFFSIIFFSKSFFMLLDHTQTKQANIIEFIYFQCQNVYLYN